MAHDLSARIEYSEKYVDDTHEYRCVPLPGARSPPLLLPVLTLMLCDYACVWQTLSLTPNRHVILPKEMQRSLPDRLLSETEWRQLGVQQSRGWVHYAIHKCVSRSVCVACAAERIQFRCGALTRLWWLAACRPEPHILLFRRPLGTDPTTGRINASLEREAKDKYAKDFN